MRITRALALALLAMALIAGPTWALAEVGNLQLAVSDSSGEAFGRDDTALFEAGIERIYAGFDYSDAAETIGVRVISPSGSEVFESSKRYNGNGRASVEITGVEMYRRLSEGLVDYAEAMEATAQDIRRSSVGYRGYLNSIESNARLMLNDAEIVATWDLASDLEGHLDDLTNSAELIMGFLDEAADIDPEDDAARQDIARSIEDEADLAGDAATALDEFGQEAEALAIPSTEADRGTAYTVQVRVAGSTSMTMEFWVTDESLPDPTATEPPPPTRGPQATPDPATAEALRTARSGSGSRDDGGDDSGGDDAAESAAERLDTERNPTAAARATAVSQQLATEEAVELEQAEALDASGEEAASESASGEAGQASSEDASGESPEALPTWTPAPGQGGDAGSGAAEGEAAGGGPNLAILGLGILALLAIALWLRRRV